MKIITAAFGAVAMTLAAFAGTAQAQGYYSAPVFTQGGNVSLGYTGAIGYQPNNYYYQQPQYVVRRTMKPIWALGQPVRLGNPQGHTELSLYSAMSVSSEQSIPLAGTFDFGPSVGMGARLAWNDPYSNLRLATSVTATKWDVERFWDGLTYEPYLRSSTGVGDFTQVATDISIGIVERNTWLSALVGVNTDTDYNYALPYMGLEFGSQAEIAPGVAIDFSVKGMREFSEATIRGFRTSGRWIATGTAGLRIKF